MTITPVSTAAATALFRQENFTDTNTQVLVKKKTAYMLCKGKEIAQLHFGEKPTLKIRNNGVFTPMLLNRLNGVLRHAGHEIMYKSHYDWLFESSQMPFGSGTMWKEIKL